MTSHSPEAPQAQAASTTTPSRLRLAALPMGEPFTGWFLLLLVAAGLATASLFLEGMPRVGVLLAAVFLVGLCAFLWRHANAARVQRQRADMEALEAFLVRLQRGTHPQCLVAADGTVLEANPAAVMAGLIPGARADELLFPDSAEHWAAILDALQGARGWAGLPIHPGFSGRKLLLWPLPPLRFETGLPVPVAMLELVRVQREVSEGAQVQGLAMAGLRFREGRLAEWNDRAEALLGPLAFLSGQTVASLFAGHAGVQDAMQEVLQSGGDETLDAAVLADHGRRLWCRLVVAGHAPDVTVLLWDASDLKRSQDAQRQAAVVFEAAGEAILVLDAERRIRMSNAAFSELSGFSADEVLGKPLRWLFSNRQPAELYDHIFHVVGREARWQGEVWGRKKDGTVYPELMTINAVRNEQGEVMEYVVLAMDVTERKRAEERLNYQANYDALTRLPNRNLFMDRLRQAIVRTRREGTQLAVLFIDLDRFKNINDSMGHSTGDKLLVLVAKALVSCVRASDTIARFGGDEFAIILSPIYGPKNASTVAQTVLNVLSQSFDVEGHECLLGGSIGISICPSDGDDPEVLMKNADAAMYRAKDQGRSTYQFFTAEMQRAALARLGLERDLRYAVERQEFILHFQPQQDLHTGEVAGLEVLVRWQSSTRGMVSPADFISLAEENGQILALGEWVLRTACRQFAEWHRRGIAPRYVAVNVSGRQFRSPGFVKLVESVLAETRIPARGLELELTESFLMEDETGVMQTLNALRAMGISLSIDDFGTGYSSLSYLKRFPISTLKIDRSFVQDVPGDDEDVAIVAAIINMAKVLRLDTVAEGVETEQQLRFLRGLGCSIVQGFYYSRPLPALDCEKFLLAHRDGGASLPGRE